MIRRLALAAAFLAVAPMGVARSAADAPAAVAPYVAAGAGGEVGEVRGIAHVEGRRPREVPTPVEGVSIYLLPFSRRLAEELDEVKRTHRDGGRAYLESGPQLVEARERYERILLAAGGGTLIRGEVSDATGAFRFAEVPAGAWMLLAWKATAHPLTGKKLTGVEVRQFRDNAERTGYAAVTYWRASVDVAAGVTSEIVLRDRNEWMTAIEEERHVPGEDTRRGNQKRGRGASR